MKLNFVVRCGIFRAWRYILMLLLALLVFAPSCSAMENERLIAPGTIITPHNWQQYKQFMPDGMQVLFAGTYFKLPDDFRIVIGPGSFYPLPRVYLQNTKRYSNLVKLKALPDGSYAVSGYLAGLPFPDPADPMKGYKILADFWYRYVPYLTCSNDNHIYLRNQYNQISTIHTSSVFRRLSHISDAGQPINDPHAQGIDYSEYTVLLAPEQYKYTQLLTLYYVDSSRPEDDFIFIPQMRRVLRQSSNSRCAPVAGSDIMPDDFYGFNGGTSRFQAQYVKDQRIFTLVNADPKVFGNTSNYYSLFLPKPEVGRWELRDQYVIDVRRIPSQRAGYCYGKQIMWVDKYSFNIAWKDLYDPGMKLLKIYMSEKIAGIVPQEGMQYFNGNSIETAWAISKGHLTSFISSGPGGKGQLSNQECRNLDGVNYDDIQTYSTAGGLNQIMR